MLGQVVSVAGGARGIGPAIARGAAGVGAKAAAIVGREAAERDMQSATLGQGEGWLVDAASRQPFGRLITAEELRRLALYPSAKESEPMTGSLVDQERFAIGAFA